MYNAAGEKERQKIKEVVRQRHKPRVLGRRNAKKKNRPCWIEEKWQNILLGFLVQNKHANNVEEQIRLTLMEDSRMNCQRKSEIFR